MMIRALGFYGFACVIAIQATFAAPEQLSRSKAKALIEASNDFQRMAVVQVSDEGAKKGEREGVWQPSVMALTLSPKAQQFFKFIDGIPMQGYRATLQSPIRGAVIEVTGIADMFGGMKEAEFSWNYVNLPSFVKRYAGRGGTGSASFRLYDDGWRITGIELKYSREPIPLTAAEAAQEEQEIREWQAQQDQERRRREEREHLARVQVTNLVHESKVSSRVLGQFSGYLSWEYGGNPGGGKYPCTLVICDKHLQISRNIQNYDLKQKFFTRGFQNWNLDAVTAMWFGDIIEVRMDYDPNRKKANVLIALKAIGPDLWFYADSDSVLNQAGNMLISAFNSWRTNYPEVYQKDLYEAAQRPEDRFPVIPPPPQDNMVYGVGQKQVDANKGQAPPSANPVDRFLVLPIGTEIIVRTSTQFDTALNRTGDIGEGTIETAIMLSERAVAVHGDNVRIKVAFAGMESNKAELAFNLIAVFLNNHTYPIATETWIQTSTGQRTSVPAGSVLNFRLKMPLTVKSEDAYFSRPRNY